VNYTLRQSNLTSSCYLSANTKNKDLVVLVTRSNLPHGPYFFHTNVFTGSEPVTAVNMKILSCQIWCCVVWWIGISILYMLPPNGGPEVEGRKLLQKVCTFLSDNMML